MILIREGRLAHAAHGLKWANYYLLEDEIWLQDDDYMEFFEFQKPEYRLYHDPETKSFHLAIAGAHEKVRVTQYIAGWRNYANMYQNH